MTYSIKLAVHLFGTKLEQAIIQSQKCPHLQTTVEVRVDSWRVKTEEI